MARNANTNLLHSDRFRQISREIHIETLSDGEPVGDELEGDDIKQPLETVHCSRDLDLFGLLRGKLGVVGIANNNWTTITSDDCRIQLTPWIVCAP